MNKLIILAMLCVAVNVQGQSSFANEVFTAELQFALQSQIRGVRYGFVNNLDTGAIGINRTGWTKLYSLWKNRPAINDGSVLVWEPHRILAGAKGLFGISTGPHYSKSGKDTSLVHGGYYFSLWARSNRQQAFKVLFDAGIKCSDSSHTIVQLAKQANLEVFQEQKISERPGQYQDAITTIQLSASESLSTFLQKTAIPQAIIVHSALGIMNKSTATSTLELKKSYQFTPASWAIVAGSALLEYGKLTINQQPGYYVHVWQLENSRPVLLAAFYKFD